MIATSDIANTPMVRLIASASEPWLRRSLDSKAMNGNDRARLELRLYFRGEPIMDGRVLHPSH